MVGRKICEDRRFFLLENYGTKVLLVEDNRVNRLVNGVLLQQWGIEVHMAHNGLEALKMAQCISFNLILMNLHMPKMDGFEATRNIRMMNEYYKQLPIIALTASSTLQCRERAGLAGITELLLKPFRPQSLYHMICKHLYMNADCVKNESLNPAQMQQKLERIAQGDADFKKQLIQLYLKSFREILDALNTGKLQDAENLRRMRHKHKTSILMLELENLEAALFNLQQILDSGIIDQVEIGCKTQDVRYSGEQIIRELEAIA
jgi:CheY-like chemotaxis protein